MPTLRNIKHSQKTILSLSASKRLRRKGQPRRLQNHPRGENLLDALTYSKQANSIAIVKKEGKKSKWLRSFIMKEEVLILPARRGNVFINGDLNGGFTKLLQRWNAHGTIDREPAYVAFYISDTKSIRAIAEVDYENSRLKEGIIATKDEPIKVNIPIRFKPRTSKKDTLLKFQYTTFRKLIIHKSTDEL